MISAGRKSGESSLTRRLQDRGIQTIFGKMVCVPLFLELEVPARCYRASPRVYRDHPTEWEYPPGSEVRTLNSQGSLELPGGRIFVCHALAGERVWCQRFEHRILVTYRQMQVREIDLATGRTTSVVRPVRQSQVSAMS